MTQTTYVIDADYFKNWSLGPSHPTQGRRYSNVKKLFNEMAQERGVELVMVEPRTATYEELARVHAPNFIIDVTQKYLRFDALDVDKEQAEIASMMAGATVQMLDALIEKKTLTAINFAGAKHHAQYDFPSGFCVFADLAIAADIATKEHGLRVAIFDFDGHHGDGTENLCANNPNVLTFSTHHLGIFPGTGVKSNVEKHIYNFPLPGHSNDTEFGQATELFIKYAKQFGAEIIFVAAGADGHIADPLTGLEFTVDGYVASAQSLRKAFPSLPFLIGGAGGYQPDDFTPEIWAKFAIEIAANADDPVVKISKKGKR